MGIEAVLAGLDTHIDESQVIDINPDTDDLERTTGAETTDDDDKSST